MPDTPLEIENAALRRDYHAQQIELQRLKAELEMRKAMRPVPRAPWHFYLLRFFTSKTMNAVVNVGMLIASTVFILSSWHRAPEDPGATYNSWLEKHREHDWSDKRAPARVQRRHTETPDADADDGQDSN